MPVDSFRFVSPGVFINEIDQSQVARSSGGASGPVIFGVAEKGPALIPTKISSFSEFVSTFGNPIPGSDGVSDVWRMGNYSNPTYGAYAAQAYLANGGPITFVRLVGDQDPAGTDKAGWEVGQVSAGGTAGTYGLFIAGTGSNTAEGVLAAVIHCKNSASVYIKGRTMDSGDSATYTLQGAFQKPGSVTSADGTACEYKLLISSSTTGRTEETTFNFKPTSARYIRKVLNTNPHLLNSSITPAANLKDYFLAESFDRLVVDNVSGFDSATVTSTNLSGTYGIVLGLSTGSAYGGYFKGKYENPATPWIVGQDLSDDVTNFDINSSVQRLFRVVSKEGVEYAQSHFKISISDVKQSPNPQFENYGTFTLLVRDIRDTDENPVILEQYNNLNLNPASNNFIAKRIGDRSYEYDTTNQKWRELGQYPVRSNLIRVQLDETVDNGDHEASLLPFGFRGVPIYTPFNLQSGSAHALAYGLDASGSLDSKCIVASGISGNLPNLRWDTLTDVSGIPTAAAYMGGYGGCQFLTASLAFPDLPQRLSSSDGRLKKTTKAFFGLTTNQAANTLVFDGVIRDLVRIKPLNIAGANVILSPGFSLDDLIYDAGDAFHSGSDIFMYCNGVVGTGNPLGATAGGDAGGSNVRRGTPQGGRRDNLSMTAVSSSYQEVLIQGFDKFTIPMYGGFDGFDIFEKNPFNNERALTGESKTTAASAEYYTLRKAIDSVSDVDQVDINMAAMPGITDSQTMDFLISMAEDRKDTLAIIDLEGGYTSSTENTDTFSARKGSSANVVTNVESREFNSSYAAAYYPWVQINDTTSSRRVWVPPSTIALGVLAASSAKAELWFAPAGFNRGGLNNSSAGLAVVNVIEKLTSDQRDNLYEVNVNPIASFPAEGIVVFGQKTLQATPSALDRINVRRLMIYLKKEIRKIANGILFDPNERVTWDRFLNQVNPFLASIKNRFGLSDYRVILDSDTTTPDLVDRNIMYAKILLKPTRAIEFIALDFVITNSGVEF